MLEKVGGTSENGAAPELDEKLLEKISYIPKVVSIEVCRYSKRTAQEFIDYINNQLVPDCKFIFSEKNILLFSSKFCIFF